MIWSEIAVEMVNMVTRPTASLAAVCVTHMAVPWSTAYVSNVCNNPRWVVNPKMYDSLVSYNCVQNIAFLMISGDFFDIKIPNMLLV